MKSRWACGFIVLFFVLSILVHAGCARTQPSRFYALTAISEIEKAAPENHSITVKTIGVGPVEIPSYLDRPQIVTLKGPHQFHMAEFDRWAGTLKENISLVIAENLSAMLPGEAVILDARWVILEREGRRILLEKGSQIRIPFLGKGYDDIVSAQSMALVELSRDIAEVIQTLPKKGD